MEKFYVGPSGFPIGGFVAYEDADCRRPLRHPKAGLGEMPPRHRSEDAAIAYGRRVLAAIAKATGKEG